MGVRSYLPSSIAFAVVVCVNGKRLRVEVILDLQERLLFVPIGLLPEVRDRIIAFVEQLGDITANVLAFQKWDAKDPTTEYQPLRLLQGYQTTRQHMRFNVVLGEPALLQVSELNSRSEVQLQD